MDLVEAIDTWIDDRIEDLSDDELEQILEILDAVSASDFADLETEHVYNDDVYWLVDLVGGTTMDRSYTEDVLRSAFYQDPFPADEFPKEVVSIDDRAAAETAEDQGSPEDDGVNSDQLADGDEVDDLILTSGESALDEPAPVSTDNPPDRPTPLAPDEDTINLDLGAASGFDVDADVDLDFDPQDLVAVALSPATAETSGSEFLADVARASAVDEKRHNDFLDDVARAGDDSDPSHEARALVQLRAGDDLGPSFLPPVADAPKQSSGAWKRWAFMIFMLGGLAVFAFGSLQLFDSLSGTEETIGGPGTAPAPQETDEPSLLPTATSAPEAVSAPVDPSAPTATPTPPPLPPPRIAIRLANGDVMLARFDDAATPADLKLMYDASDDDLVPSAALIWLNDMFVVVDNDGNILLLNPDTPSAEPQLIYEVGGGLDAALEVAAVNQDLAARTSDGDVTLVPMNGSVDADNIEFLWNASEEEVRATDIAAVHDLIAVVLETGAAHLIDTADDNSVDDFWQIEDRPPAVNVAASDTGILLGVGQGSVELYRFDEQGRNEFETLWDPADDDNETPAIAYTPVGANTAIVLATGAVLLDDGSRVPTDIWNPEETEIRALALTGEPEHVITVLESGSVIRIPLRPEESITSIWDLTDESLSPARQVAVEVTPTE